MKKLKILVVTSIMVLIISATLIIAFAAVHKTPAQAVAGISGKDLEKVIAERKEKNIRYGTMAKEAGTITQEKADEIIVTMERNYENCDGTGQKGLCGNIGLSRGIGFEKGYETGKCQYNARWNGENYAKANINT